MPFFQVWNCLRFRYIYAIKCQSGARSCASGRQNCRARAPAGIHRDPDCPAGKGIADIVFYPKAGSEKPAIIVELKWNQTEEAALAQIKKRNYPKSLKEYHGEVLLVGINYKKATKEHTCKIEEITL